MAGVTFIDTETLGLDPDHNPVWEVGLIRENGEEVEFQIKVTPRERALAHPIALEISRFEERYNDAEALAPAVACHRLSTLIPKRSHLAGAVVSFDEERLRRLMWRWDYAPPWHYHPRGRGGAGGGQARQEPALGQRVAERGLGRHARGLRPPHGVG